MDRNTIHDPFLVNSVQRGSKNSRSSSSRMGRVAGGVAASVISLIIFSILLAIPIAVLIIGTRYQDPRYCPIQPRISLFLIVHGSASLGWIIFTILVTVITMCFAAKRSSISVVLISILGVVTFLDSIFSIIWLIIGSVWTFGVHSRVIHEYDTLNHFYLYTYCHPVLYKFTFVYLIISYGLITIQCWFECSTSPLRSRET